MNEFYEKDTVGLFQVHRSFIIKRFRSLNSVEFLYTMSTYLYSIRLRPVRNPNEGNVKLEYFDVSLKKQINENGLKNGTKHSFFFLFRG